MEFEIEKLKCELRFANIKNNELKLQNKKYKTVLVFIFNEIFNIMSMRDQKDFVLKSAKNIREHIERVLDQ